ncbi:MAG: type I methionyl aminopeptidase [Acidimicrobiales bacterium]
MPPVRRRRHEIATMRRAGQVVAEIVARTREAARPGVTTAELERVARQVLDRRGARSNFLDRRGFPAAICTSVNEVVAYGVPDDRRLVEGDVLTIDCGAMVDGYHADAAYTVPVGAATADAERLVEAAEASLWAGIAQVRCDQPLHLVGRAIERAATGAGFSVVRAYGGHAIGTDMHEPPPVPNYWPGHPGPTLKVGMVLAVEPMLVAGSPTTCHLGDDWHLVTADGSLSAHFGHNVALTEDGPEVLTADREM